MAEPKVDMPLRVGLLLTAISLFLYMLYEFVNGIINRGPLTIYFVYMTDVPQGVGMGSRTFAGLIAVVALLFFALKRDLSKPEAFMAARFAVLFEAGYWLTFLPSGILGLQGFTNGGSSFLNVFSGLVENTLPCLLQSIVLVAVLVKLFLELSPNKSHRGAIKWALIAGTVYIFAFWLNNTGNWISAVITKGTNYLLLYPANLFSFLLTTVGLLALAIYAAYFTKKTIGADSIAKVNLHKVGVIVTLLGMYFLGLYVMWLFLGSVGGWGTWYAWLLGHNLDLWAMSLPLVGIPLLFRKEHPEPAT